jgi:anti-sigma factor RsiW
MSYLHRFNKLLSWARRPLRWSRSEPTADLTCEDVVGIIAAYLSGTLAPETAAAFEAHLRGCDNCIAFLNTYKHTITMVRSLRFEDLPEEMEGRVREFLALRRRGAGDERWPPSWSAPSLIGRLFARLRRLSTDAEDARLILLPFVAIWTC